MFGTLRWTVSFVLVLGLHALAIGMLAAGDRTDESPPASSPPILVELAELPVEIEILPEEAEAVATHDAASPPTAPEGSASTSAEPPQTCDPHAAESDKDAGRPVTLKEWQGLLQHHLDRHKQYPAEAQRRGQQGTPHIVFTMCRDGRVLEAHVLQTSGFSSLDQAGMDMVRGAEPLPGFPQGQSGDTLSVVVPVEFSLKRQLY